MFDPISIVTNGFHSNLAINRNLMIALGGYAFLAPLYIVKNGGSGNYPAKHPLVNQLEDFDGKEIKVNLYINDSKITQSILKTNNKITITNVNIVEKVKKVSIKLI